MKAMILCAGYGTRLGELTREIPKPMIDIAGKPLLEYIIKQLAKYGFDQLFINLHFRTEVITSYFEDGSNWGVQINYSYEPELMGTGGGIKKMESCLALDDFFLVHYGDILTDQDYYSMVRYHQSKNALATLLLHKRAHSNSIVRMDQSGRIIEFIERPGPDIKNAENLTWVNSGVYICSPDIFKYIPQDQAFDLPRDLFASIYKSKRLYGYPLDGFRCAIDSQKRYQEAIDAVREGRVFF